MTDQQHISEPVDKGVLRTAPIDYQAMYSILARHVTVAAEHIQYQLDPCGYNVVEVELESAMELIKEVEKLQRTLVLENKGEE